MAFSLGSLAEVFSKLTRSFTAKSGKSVIGIDIGLSSIKVVQVSEQKGGAFTLVATLSAIIVTLPLI